MATGRISTISRNTIFAWSPPRATKSISVLTPLALTPYLLYFPTLFLGSPGFRQERNRQSPNVGTVFYFRGWPLAATRSSANSQCKRFVGPGVSLESLLSCSVFILDHNQRDLTH